MPYGITQCYLPPGRGDIPAFTTAEAGTQFSDPRGMQGWVDPGGWLDLEMVYPLNGHPSWTNWARCWLTSLMRPTTLTTTPSCHPNDVRHRELNPDTVAHLSTNRNHIRKEHIDEHMQHLNVVLIHSCPCHNVSTCTSMSFWSTRVHATMCQPAPQCRFDPLVSMPQCVNLHLNVVLIHSCPCHNVSTWAPLSSLSHRNVTCIFHDYFCTVKNLSLKSEKSMCIPINIHDITQPSMPL